MIRATFCVAVKPELIAVCPVQFWELDTDHDFFICKEDLLRYGNHSLTYRIVDRIFSQVSYPLMCFQRFESCCATWSGARLHAACRILHK